MPKGSKTEVVLMLYRSKFEMPNLNTFEIPSIGKLIEQYQTVEGFFDDWLQDQWIDPFANRQHRFATITNDLNPDADTDFNMDALDFLKMQATNSASVLLDPPYTLRQIKECYDGFGVALSSHESRHFYSDIKDEIARIVPPFGFVISCGYNSNGMGRSRGFELVQVLLVPHGGNHHDTIVTVEKKVQHGLSEY